MKTPTLCLPLLLAAALVALSSSAGCADAPTGTVEPPTSTPPAAVPESCDGIACPQCHGCVDGRCVRQPDCTVESCDLQPSAGVLVDPTHGAYDIAMVDGHMVITTAVGVEVYAPLGDAFEETPVATFVLDGHGLTLAVDGFRAAIAHGTSVTVLDISDPTDLKWLASAEFTEPVLGIDLDGERMAVGLGNHLTKEGLPEGAVAGTVQMFRWEGAYLVPLADPVALDGPAHDVRLDLSADRVFVAAGLAGLVIADFAAAPTITSTLEFSHTALRVKRWQDKWLVAADRAGLRVVQETGGVLTEIGAFEVTSGTNVIVTDVVMKGELAIVGARYLSTLHVIDLSNPAAPIRRGAVDTNNGGTLPQRLALGLDNSVWFAGAGVHQCNIADPVTPTYIGQLGQPRRTSRAMATSSDGSFAYVVGSGGLRVIGGADSEAPRVVASVPFDFGAISVATAGRHVVVGLDATIPIVLYGKVAIVDVADPSQPVVTGVTSQFSGRPADLLVHNNVLFVAASTVLKFDIADPTSPVLHDGISGTSGVGALALHGTTLAVSKRYQGVDLYDVSAPLDPKLLGSIQGISDTHTLTAANGVLAIGTLKGATTLVGIENPLAPEFLATIQGAESPLLAVAKADKLWLATANGIRLYDIRDPRRPALESITATVGETTEAIAVATGAPLNIWTTSSMVPLSHHATTCEP